MRLILLLIVSTMLVQSCGQVRKVSAGNLSVRQLAKEHVDTLQFPAKENSVFVLKKTLDLGGKTYLIPKGVTIKVRKGVIRNGSLIGQGTEIKGVKPVFDKVTIAGVWVVPVISTELFKDLSYDNSLRDVMALTNEAIANNVEIQEGIYYIHLSKNNETGFYIHSNTTVTLKGEIRLKPNGFANYQVVELTGTNCSLIGNGVIVGDKPVHQGTSGEWGMGVFFSKAVNSCVSGVTIKDCWGDCIYVGNVSKNVTIENCALDNGRRQGISITSADSVFVNNSIISNVSGTNPQYAIDIEPNRKESVDHILIKNVETINCEGGILATVGKYNPEHNKRIGDVKVINCHVSAISKYPIRLSYCESVTVEGCEVSGVNRNIAVSMNNSQNVRIKNNTIFVKKGLLARIKSVTKGTAGNIDNVAIEINGATQKEVDDNRLLE